MKYRNLPYFWVANRILAASFFALACGAFAIAPLPGHAFQNRNPILPRGQVNRPAVKKTPARAKKLPSRPNLDRPALKKPTRTPLAKSPTRRPSAPPKPSTLPQYGASRKSSPWSKRVNQGYYGSVRQNDAYKKRQPSVAVIPKLPQRQGSSPSGKIVSGLSQVGKPVEAICRGSAQLYGSGSYRFRLRGSMRIDEGARVSIKRDSDFIKKQRVEDGWFYPSLDDEIVVSGSNVKLTINGDLREFKGEGSGSLILKGQGSYRTQEENGSIPREGITVDFGRPSGGPRIGSRGDSAPVAIAERVRVSCNGSVDLYGRGTYKLHLLGEFRVSESTRVVFQRETENMEKVRAGDDWVYRKVNGEFTVSGTNIKLGLTGTLREMEGNGSGTLVLSGRGNYRTNKESGAIPQSGINLDFGGQNRR